MHVTHRYLPGFGGTERLLASLANRQATSGHQVTVVAPSTLADLSVHPPDTDVLPLTETIGQISIRRFRVTGAPLGQLGFNALRRGLRVIGDLKIDRLQLLSQMSIRLALELSRLTPASPDIDRVLTDATKNADLVHFCNVCYEGFGWRAMLAARRYRLPFVVTPIIHLGESVASTVRRYYTMPQQLSLCRHADHIFAMTDLEAGFLHDSGIDAGKITVAGGGVEPAMYVGDATRFRKEHRLGDRRVVLYLGPTHPDKGVHTFVEAGGILNSSGQDVALVVIGQSSPAFQRWLRRGGWDEEPWLRAIGTVDEQRKADALAACSALALPSRTDSLGLVVLEAWQAGKPVIVARAGGLPAVVSDGLDGLIVNYNNAPQLALAIKRLLTDAALAASLAANGRDKVARDYNWDSLYPKLQSVYDRLGLDVMSGI